jgi:hypothetical protein
MLLTASCVHGGGAAYIYFEAILLLLLVKVYDMIHCRTIRAAACKSTRQTSNKLEDQNGVAKRGVHDITINH